MSLAHLDRESISLVPSCERPSLAPRRVRVYLLLGDDWIDNGTGYCLGDIGDFDTPYFVVRNEQEPQEVILESTLKGVIQYQRQQDTLIVWTDSCGKDLALSFQETDGCIDLCEFIVRVQREGFSPNISLYYVTCNGENGEDVTELINGPVPVPDRPTKSNLASLLELLQSNCHSSFQRMTLSRKLIDMNYFSHLVSIFDVAESAHVLLVILKLGDIVRALVRMREQCLIEDILATPAKLHGIVGILEYQAPNLKAPFRELLNKSTLKHVFNLEQVDTFEKDINLLFLRDVAFAGFIDEDISNSLTALICANRQRIVERLQTTKVLPKLFDIYFSDSKLPFQSKHDGVRLVHHFLQTSKILAREQKLAFYSALVESGLVRMIQFAFDEGDPTVQTLALEIVMAIIDFDILILYPIGIDDLADPVQDLDIENEDSVVRNAIRRAMPSDMSFISLFVQILGTGTSSALQSRAFDVLCDLLNPKIGNSPDEEFELEAFQGPVYSQDAPRDLNTEGYFKAFYRGVAPNLFKPLTDVVRSDAFISFQMDKKLQYLCELALFCATHHDQKIARDFFINNGVLEAIARVLVLNCSNKLKLCALGSLKKLVALNNNTFTQRVIDLDLLAPFFECLDSVKSHNNMINSCCLSFLDMILTRCTYGASHAYHNYRLLAVYIVGNFAAFCSTSIGYVDTGTDLVRLVNNDFEPRLDLALDRDSDITEACNTKQTLGLAMEMPGTYKSEERDCSSDELDLQLRSKQPIYIFESLELDLVVDAARQKRRTPEQTTDIRSMNPGPAKKSNMNIDPQFSRALVVESDSPSNL